MGTDTLFLLHAISTWFMAGVIWFVQVVHYPLFAGVGREGFARYEAAHSRRTTWVVVGPMVVELGTGLLLLARGGIGRAPEHLVGLALLAIIWLSTAFLQVPRHRELDRGFDERAHRRLVDSNWVRTVAWSLRAALVTAVLTGWPE